MRGELGAGYTSRSQKARVVTEAWVEDNMFCPACDRDSLPRMPRGYPLIDFRCANCDEGFQLKAQDHPFGRRVLDSAWPVMHEAVSAGIAPGFMFMEYNGQSWAVQRLF